MVTTETDKNVTEGAYHYASTDETDLRVLPASTRALMTGFGPTA